MFAKKLLQKATHNHHRLDDQHENLKEEDFNPQILCHLGIPSTASILDVDPVQHLLAIGTLDGRIKVLGGNNIEALLISLKQQPYKYLKFLQNKGYLVGISNDNDIQVWNLESRLIFSSLQWDSNITAFSVISGSMFMIVGDEYGEVSILKCAPEDGKLVEMPYRISPHIIAENTGIFIPDDQPVVGVLPQPSYFGDRLVIVYQCGLIILWDVIEAQVVSFKGNKDLLIKGHLSDSPRKLDADSLDSLNEDMHEKEISALCWSSSIGSILAVGYIDGDILLWDFGAPSKCSKTGASCNDVVKLQLSSAEKRLPVIILHWCESGKSQNSCSGQLFVYGGCEIGSEEVITVVSMNWSAGMETLKSVSRVDLSVNNAFADMVFLSSFSPAEGNNSGLFLLTRPGELQFYDMEFLSSLAFQHEKKSSATGLKFPVAVPTTDPQITATKLSSHAYNGNVSMWLSEITSFGSTPGPGKCTKWPLTGGTQTKVPSADEKPQKRLFIVGYKDGSVRVRDATSSTFSLVSVLEGQVHGIENVGSNISVTSFDFCESMMNLAVGSECGVVRVYSLTNGMGGTKLHWVKQSEQKVYDIPPRKGLQCRAVFLLVNARVRSLQFSVTGAKLAVGFESGHVAVLDVRSLSVIFFTSSAANSPSPTISAILKTYSDARDFSKGAKHIGSKNTERPLEELLFTLTQDSKVNVLDCTTGSSIATRPLQLKNEHTAINIHVLEGSEFMSTSSSQQHEHSKEEHVSPNICESRSAEQTFSSGEKLMDSHLLLCCEDVIRLYHMKSVMQGDDKPLFKVKLAKSCCWSSIFRKDDKIGLILVYQSGTIEIRLLPSLELLLESSLNSALRWNFRPNMENKTSFTDHGHICLVNGSEVVFLSLSMGEIETKFLESLPLLHDNVMAAAADAAIHYSVKHKKQVSSTGILGGIVKGFKKETNNTNDTSSLSNFIQLEGIFSQPVVPDSSLNTLENKEEKEQEQEQEELDIDDIEIDDLILATPTSSNQAKGKTSEKHKEKLFEGKPMDAKPKTRTPEEIMAAYRGAEYASAAAERARNKLLERQDKLDRINQRTEDLRNEAEDFASMAHELARTMEGRKRWWKI